MGRANGIKNRFAPIVTMAAMTLMAIACSGCVFSNTVTLVVYDQDESNEIDYDAPKQLVNSPYGDQKTSELPLLQATAEGSENLDDIPDYDGVLSDEEIVNADHVGDGKTQSDSMSNGNDTKRENDAGNDHDDAAQDEPETKKGDSSSDSSSRGESDSQSARDTPSDNGEESDAGDSASNGGQGNAGEGAPQGKPGDSANPGGGPGDDPGPGGNDPSPSDPSNNGREPGKVFSNLGSNDELPTGVHTVAAVGNAAVVTAVLGGADGSPNLVAADSQLLSSQASSVLASRSIAAAQACWSGNGTAAGSTNLEALSALAPDAVLVSVEGPALSEAEVAAITTNGTHIVYVPGLTSPENIVACVTRVGTLLARGDDAQAQNMANTYVQFHDEVVSHCSDFSQSAFTIYVDEWRSGAYSGTYKKELQVTGAAFAPSGLASQPLSAYMGAAGTYNTPGVKTMYNVISSRAIVWPFKGGTRDDEWSGISNVNGGLSTNSTGYDFALTRITPVGETTVYDLGVTQFPAIVVANTSVKTKIEEDRARDNGVYSGNNADSSIADKNFKIFLNPHGLFSSWASGSLESVLEAAWARDAFQVHDAYFEDRLRYFYSTFYGYDLADTSAVVNATYAL